MSPLAQKTLDIAISQIGQEEHPRGSNWGSPVKEYLASVGINFPASWCMALMYWCHSKAAQELNIKTTLHRSGGVLNVWNNTPEERRTQDPQPGMIGIMDFGHGLGHTFIIESVEGDKLHTVEGNTNDTGSREGYEVCRRIRLKSKVKGYIIL